MLFFISQWFPELVWTLFILATTAGMFDHSKQRSSYCSSLTQARSFQNNLCGVRVTREMPALLHLQAGLMTEWIRQTGKISQLNEDYTTLAPDLKAAHMLWFWSWPQWRTLCSVYGNTTDWMVALIVQDWTLSCTAAPWRSPSDLKYCSCGKR